MTDKNEYIPKVGDIVEIIVYEDATDIGIVIEVENWGTKDSRLIIQTKEGYISDPWYADNNCVRLLTPLEQALW